MAKINNLEDEYYTILESYDRVTLELADYKANY